jgi:hypothetical protein
MATINFDNNDGAGNGRVSVAANWHGGTKPVAGDAVTLSVSAMEIDETFPATGSLLSFVTTGHASPTISGSGALAVGGTFTLGTGTVWTHTGGTTLNLVAHVHITFAGRDVSSDVFTVNMTPTGGVIYNFDGTAPTFGQLNISLLAERRDCYIDLAHDLTINASSSWLGGGTGADDPTIRPMIRSSAIGTGRTVTVSGTLTMQDVDLQDIVKAAGGTWVASRASDGGTGAGVGDCGGNTAGMCSDPKTVYADMQIAATYANRVWWDNIWTTSSGGGSQSLNNYPLPQDTAIIDNGTGDNTGDTLNINSVSNPLRIGNIYAADLSEFLTLNMGLSTGWTLYGSLTFAGSNLAVGTSSTIVITVDARVKNELAGALLVINSSDDTDWGGPSITIDSYGGTVQLASALTHMGTFTHTRGTLDLYGQALTTNFMSSSNANTRNIRDSVGGGKIVAAKVTGTALDFATDTNMTTGNAGAEFPAIQAGTSALTLTANVILAFGSTVAKTFGALSFKKYKGNYAYAITGTGNTFGAVTQETPDAGDTDFMYNSVTWPASASGNTVADYDVTGQADHHCFIQSSAAGSPAHLTRSGAGTCSFSHTTIQDIHVATGTWDASDGTNVGAVGAGNDGWTWPSAGGIIPVIMHHYLHNMRV